MSKEEAIAGYKRELDHLSKGNPGYNEEYYQKRMIELHNSIEHVQSLDRFWGCPYTWVKYDTRVVMKCYLEEGHTGNHKGKPRENQPSWAGR